MKKYLIAGSMSMLLLGLAGCATTSTTNTSITSPTETTVVNENAATTNDNTINPTTDIAATDALGTEVNATAPEKEAAAQSDTSSTELIPNDATYTHESFSFKFPTDWRIESTVDDYDDLSSAMKSGGNYVQLYNYPRDKYDGGSTFTQDDLKIEVWVYNDIQQTLTEWVDAEVNKTANDPSLKTTVTKSEDITVNGIPAKKIHTQSSFGQTVLIYAVDKNMGVYFAVMPINSLYLNQADAVIDSFAFKQK